MAENKRAVKRRKLSKQSKTKKRAFYIAKPYKYIRRFKIRKTGPIKRLIENLKSLFKPKKTINEIKAYAKKGESYKLMSTAAFVSAAMLAMAALYIIYLLSLLSNLPHAVVSPPLVYANMSESFLSNFGTIYQKTNAFYAAINVMSNGKTSIQTYVYQKPISTTAYILDGPRYEADNYDETTLYLISMLNRIGITTTKIGVGNIDEIPEGSILIIPTGKPPLNSIERILKAMNRGVNVFYVGIEPTEEVGPNGEFISRIEKIPKDISFERQHLTPSESLNMLDGVYVIREGELIFDSISVLQYGRGTFVVFPNLPDIGWSKGSFLAKDIVHVLESLQWVGQPIDRGDIYSKNGMNTFFTNPINPNNAYILYKIVGDNNGKQSYYFLSSYGISQPTTIYPQGDYVFLPFSVRDIPMQLYITTQKRGIDRDNLWIDIFNGTDYVDKITIGNVNIGDEHVVSYRNMELGIGSYLLKLRGAKGGLYGMGGFQLGRLYVDVSDVSGNDKIDITFYLLNRKVRLSDVNIRITKEDGTYADVSFSKVSNVTIDLNELFNNDVPVGIYNVSVSVGDFKESYTARKYPRTGINRLLNPTNIGILILSGIIYVIGMIFAKKEEEFFYIDIPDFPPLESIEVKISTEDIKRIFEEINKFYKWKFTPMTLEEIKIGFRTIKHNGSPIYISDFNLEFILDKLKSRGIVKESMGYYGLTDWEKKSGFTMEQLAMFRKMRDICLLNAIKFTELSKKKDYHTQLKIIWQNAYVYFYSDKDRDFILKNGLKVVNKGLVIVLFTSDDERMRFIEILRSDSKLANAFYLHVKIGDISLLTIDEFEDKMVELRHV